MKAADEVVQHVSRLRGLQPKGPIHKGVKSREEISRYLADHVRDSQDEGELQNEGKMLHRLGLIPEAVDYKSFMLDLLTEQVGGYYDPELKEFFIAGWLSAAQQLPIMVHELTHALQDQHFDLNRVIKQDRDLHNDDRAMARHAIFEGDAMAVMLDFLLEPEKKSFTQLPDLVAAMRSQFSSMDEQYEVFRRAPVYVKETLLFPYSHGAAFLQKIRKTRSWSEVNRLYSDLPVSSEQILHPEKYLAERDDPKPVEVEDVAARLGAGWEAVYRNVLGEFALCKWLQLHLPEEVAESAAAGWGGDRVVLVEGEGGRVFLLLATIWDTPGDAAEFYSAAAEWLSLHFPGAREVEQSEKGCAFVTSGEYHSLRREDARVEVLLGLPESLGARFQSAR